jgi:hypothetical protein
MVKGKVHYIEVLSDEEYEREEETHCIPYGGQNSNGTPHLELT